MEKRHYDAIDGLRTFAAIGIVMMHMATNNSYDISGFLYKSVIPSFTNFVFLFMIISAFGMCCGYCKKILNNEISMTVFYSKRFKKILPFFGVLVLLDVIISPSIDAFYEAFADLTLLFGFLSGTKSISVIGVGWFLGLIFVFYICFPFYCVLIENKRRAWTAFAISILYNIVCSVYFEVGRANILYSSCYFLAGGLIYLYREKIYRWNRYIVLVAAVVMSVLYYIIGGNTATILLVSSSCLMYAVISKGKILNNRVTKFISSISMEIYLSHMVIFRVIERLGLNLIFGDGWGQYIITFGLVFSGTILFAVIVKKLISIIENKIQQMKNTMPN